MVEAGEAAIPRGEVLLELLESTYVAFRDRVEAIKRHTTCQCNACRLIPALDLKFIVHFGEYVLQGMGGVEKPIGSAVNLLHRLSKNGVTDVTGWRAYILLTETAAVQLGLDLTTMQRGVETYEHLGEVMTFSSDLAQRYRDRVAARQVIVLQEEAHAAITVDVPAPPPIVWEWLNDPRKRLEWEGLQIVSTKMDGRRGVGTYNHCVHGKQAAQIQEILDWRPFDYYTYQARMANQSEPMVMVTHEIAPAPNGVRLNVRMRLLGRGPDVMKRMLARFIVTRNHVADNYRRLVQLVVA